GLLSGPLLLGGLLLGRLLLRGPLLGGPLLGSTLLGLTLLGGPRLLGGDLLRALAHGLAGLRGGADGAGHLGGGPLAQLGVAGLAHLIDDEVDLADALLGHLGAGLVQRRLHVAGVDRGTARHGRDTGQGQGARGDEAGEDGRGTVHPATATVAGAVGLRARVGQGGSGHYYLRACRRDQMGACRRERYENVTNGLHRDSRTARSANPRPGTWRTSHPAAPHPDRTSRHAVPHPDRTPRHALRDGHRTPGRHV